MAEVYHRESGAVTDRVRSLLFDRTSVEDIVQDVFVKLWQHPARFDFERGTLRTYLVNLARSRALDVLRAESARRSREARSEQWFPRARTEADVETTTLSGAVADQVREAVMALSPNQSAILLAFFGGRTYRQVALDLGLAEGTVKSQIRSGLGKLRPMLTNSEAHPPRQERSQLCTSE